MSTSKLQRRVSDLLSTYLGHWTIRENYRPEWLEGLELDFFFEEIDAAIEVQGRQHYQFVEVFHATYDGFRVQRARDKSKLELCITHGVILYEVANEEDAILIIERLAGIKINHPIHPAAIPRRVEEFLCKQPKTRRWLNTYKKAVKAGRTERAQRYRDRIAHFLETSWTGF